MAKIYIEDKEVEITEKVTVEEDVFDIKSSSYKLERIEKITFTSSIFPYDDISVLVTKIKQFGKGYYKVIVFNDNESKAWNLILISEDIKTRIKRLSQDFFIVIGESANDQIVSQISFCKLQPSGKVVEYTINFTKLKDLIFIDDKYILIATDEDSDEKTLSVLSLYNYEGKLIKNLYEYYKSDDTVYSYRLEKNVIYITKLKSKRKSEEKYFIDSQLSLPDGAERAVFSLRTGKQD